MKWILVLCGIAAFAAHAQDAQPVPSREVFIDQSCVPAMVRELGDDPARRDFARAACGCSYRLLSDRETMTRDEFDAAATLCRAEYEQDGAGFLDRYRD